MFADKDGGEVAPCTLSQKEQFKDIIVVCYIDGPNESGIPVFTSLNSPFPVSMNWPCD